MIASRVYAQMKQCAGALSVLFCLAISAEAAVLYKSYVIRQDRRVDILCEPYIVKKNDYVIKLFKEKGEISEKDFPEFLNIFQRLNPSIRNVNRIVPGQHLLIPLKKLSQDALPGQQTGVVTIPFMTLVDADKLLKDYTDSHRVKKGDTVSVLISRKFGSVSSASYRDGIRLFKFMNPSVTDLNHIYLGQKLHLPDPAIRKEPWFSALLTDTGKLTNQIAVSNLILSGDSSLAVAQSSKKGASSAVTGMMRAATLMDARIVNRGTYYFPSKQGNDVKLDLAQHPMMQFKNGRRILFTRQHPIPKPDLGTISAYWPQTSSVALSTDASYEAVLDAVGDVIRPGGFKNRLTLNDDGIVFDIHARWVIEEPGTEGEEPRHICWMPAENQDDKIPPSVVRYLASKNVIIRALKGDEGHTDQIAQEEALGKPSYIRSTILPVSDQRRFTQRLLEALNYPYSPNGQITFPYAGVQVQAISNIVLKPDGNPLLIDFGEFYGDAVSALTASGFDILQVSQNDTYPEITNRLLKALDVSYEINPRFNIPIDPGKYRIRMTIPGTFIPKARASKALIADRSLPEGILSFLKARDIIVMSLGSE